MKPIENMLAIMAMVFIMTFVIALPVSAAITLVRWLVP